MATGKGRAGMCPRCLRSRVNYPLPSLCLGVNWHRGSLLLAQGWLQLPGHCPGRPWQRWMGQGWCSRIPEPGFQPVAPCQQSLQPPCKPRTAPRCLPLPGTFPPLKCTVRPARVFPTCRSVPGHRAMDIPVATRNREEAWLQHPPPAASPAPTAAPRPSAREVSKRGICSFPEGSICRGCSRRSPCEPTHK